MKVMELKNRIRCNVDCLLFMPLIFLSSFLTKYSSFGSAKCKSWLSHWEWKQYSRGEDNSSWKWKPIRNSGFGSCIWRLWCGWCLWSMGCTSNIWYTPKSAIRGHIFSTGFCYFLSSFMLSILNKLLLHLQHGAAVIDDKIYIFGGNHNGRYLSDLQVCKICLMHASSCHL